MTQEQKDLLLQDLSGRLPYGVALEQTYKVTVIATNEEEVLTRVINLYSINTLDDMTVSGMHNDGDEEICFFEEIKPYLFPLSSMTEEQKQEYTYIVNYISSDDTENWKEGEFIYIEQFTRLMHFYHTNHLDYMGLIPMGLANDATGKNIY